jgi:zinc protease
MSFVPYSFNVGGSFKSLYFQGQSLVKDADEMVKVGFELVTQPGFRDEDFSKVRNQLLDFAKKRRKTTRERAFYYMFDKIFNNHPYAYSDATEESINQMSKDDIVKLQKKYFQPSILTIVMVGDMTHKEMTKLANKYFGIWKSKSPAPAKTSIPAAQALDGREIKVYQDKEYTESTINIGFAPFNNIDEEDEEVIDVLNHILASSALTSRIGIELRDKRGLVYGVKSQLWSSGDPIGYWKFQTKTAPKNTEQVIGIIYTEIHKMLESGITDNELNTAKKRLFGLMPFYVETPDDIATQTFDLLRHKKPLNTFDKKADRLLAVTKEKVLAAARKYFTLDKFIIVVDGPIEEHSLDSLKLQLPKSVKY